MRASGRGKIDDTITYLISMSFDFECQPHTSNKAISSIYNELLINDDQLNRRPAYQRSPVWDEEQKANLIDTIMSRCPMPIFLLYMFEDINECIDGQNRLTTIKEYIEQTSDTAVWAWIREQEDTIEFIYFLNPKTKDAMTEYCNSKSKPTKGRGKKKIYRLMTAQEVKKFNSYQCTISEIQTKLSFEQRKEIFLRWQSGTGISQCDRFKNESYPFCEFIITEELERTLGNRVCSILKAGRKNWLFDLYRMINVFYEGNDTCDKIILSTIKVRSKITSETDFSSEKHSDAVKRLDKFLSKFTFLIDKSLYISELLNIAFIWKLAKQEVRDILEQDEFMISFIKDIAQNDKIKRNTLNNGPQEKEIISEFPIFKQLLMASLDEKIDVSNNRTKSKSKANIPAARKTEVWNEHIGEEHGMAKCVCCGIRDIKSRDFHCGHIIPEADGGSIEVENLRPICAICNLGMGSKNMISWMKYMYPLRNLI